MAVASQLSPCFHAWQTSRIFTTNNGNYFNRHPLSYFSALNPHLFSMSFRVKHKTKQQHQQQKQQNLYNLCKELIASFPLWYHFLSLQRANSDVLSQAYDSVFSNFISLFLRSLKLKPSPPTSLHSSITFAVRPLLTKLCRTVFLCKNSHRPGFICSTLTTFPHITLHLWTLLLSRM